MGSNSEYRYQPDHRMWVQSHTFSCVSAALSNSLVMAPRLSRMADKDGNAFLVLGVIDVEFG